MENLLLLIRTLKNKIYKYMTSTSKTVYVDKLYDKVINTSYYINIGNAYKCNNTYHSAIKIKPIDIKSSTYINSNKEVNDKDPQFKIGDIVRIPKYKKFSRKVMFETGLKKYL